jgi:hypothetical protein
MSFCRGVKDIARVIVAKDIARVIVANDIQLPACDQPTI